MSEQLKAAIARSVLGAMLTAILTFLGTLQMTDFADPNRMEISMVAAGIAFCTYVLGRGLGEGSYDTKRQKEGDIRVSDVGAMTPPQTEA